MLRPPERSWWLIPGSLLVAFLWQFWPMEQAWRSFAPDLLVIVTLYWTLRRPLQVNSEWAFAIGLLRDGIEGTPLGMHALGMVVISYAIQLLSQRMRLFALWQQAATVAGIYLLYTLIGNWAQLLNPVSASKPLLLLPAIGTGLTWPVCFLGLRKLEEGSVVVPVRP